MRDFLKGEANLSSRLFTLLWKPEHQV